MGRAGGHDHLPRADRAHTVRALHGQTGQARAFEIQPLYLRPVEDVEIGPRTNLHRQIGDVGGDAFVVDVGDRDRKITVAEIGVHIFAVIETFRLCGVHHRRRVAGPDIGKQPAHADRPVRAVERAVEIAVRFQLPEIGQHVVPAPAGGAAPDPVFVIQRAAAIRHHAVDGRSAADHPALLIQLVGPRIGRVAGARRHRDAQLRPDEAPVVIGDPGEPVLELIRQAVGRIVRARFDQQHAVGGPRAEPVRQHTAGGAAADDDVIVDRVVHFPFPAIRFETSPKGNNSVAPPTRT